MTKARRNFFVIRISSFFARVDTSIQFWFHRTMKTVAALLLLALVTSCTTIANRRDLYSPQPAPGLDWHRQAATVQAEEATLPAYR